MSSADYHVFLCFIWASWRWLQQRIWINLFSLLPFRSGGTRVYAHFFLPFRGEFLESIRSGKDKEKNDKANHPSSGMGGYLLSCLFSIISDRLDGYGMSCYGFDLANDNRSQLGTEFNHVVSGRFNSVNDIILCGVLSYLLKDRKRIFIALNLMMAVALVMQYSGLNSFLFNGLRYELKYPLGRFCEVLPHAVIGIDLYIIEKKISNSLKKRLALLGATIAVCVLTYFVQDVFPCAGFYYQGFYLIFLAASIYELFAIIPFGKLPGIVKQILYKASSYTLGIYCMHRLMATLTSSVIIKVGLISDISEIYGLGFCAILYVLCYVVSVVIGLIPNKYVKQLVS